MLVGGVVEDQIHNDADVALVRFGDKAVEVGEGAVLRVDVGVVGDVVAEVDLRRRIDGGEPDGVDAERLEIVEARGDAVEVADAVAVGVLETARIDFVDDGVLPPVGILVVRGGRLLSERDRAESQREDDTRETAGRCFHFVVYSQRNGTAFGRSSTAACKSTNEATTRRGRRGGWWTGPRSMGWDWTRPVGGAVVWRA